jgi:hypothetical protein
MVSPPSRSPGRRRAVRSFDHTSACCKQRAAARSSPHRVQACSAVESRDDPPSEDSVTCWTLCRSEPWAELRTWCRRHPPLSEWTLDRTEPRPVPRTGSHRRLRIRSMAATGVTAGGGRPWHARQTARQTPLRSIFPHAGTERLRALRRLAVGHTENPTRAARLGPCHHGTRPGGQRSLPRRAVCRTHRDAR